MKKKSLGQMAFEAHHTTSKGQWALIQDYRPWVMAWNKSANTVAREVRKRDNAKYEKIRQQARANAVSVAGN